MNELERLSRQLEDMDRRIRQVEGGQRSGLSSIGFAGNQTPTTLSTFGENNWSNLGGNAPEVTVTTGSRVALTASWRVNRVGSPGSVVGINDFVSIQLVGGIGVDSALPNDFLTPTMRSQFISQEGDGLILNVAQTLATFRDDLVPGEHVFKLLFYATENNPSGTVDPQIDDMALIVTPLGYS